LVQPGYTVQLNSVASTSAPQWMRYATALTPQTVENVEKDEDPVYGPLGRAKRKVERALLTDDEISPDLGDLLMNRESC
jgi:nuclear pore complex protein Nup155